MHSHPAEHEPAARRDLAVPADLAPYVLGIRVHESSSADVAPHSVLPGPYPVLGCRWSGSLRAVGGHGERLLARSGFTGLQPGPATYRPGPGTRTLLVYLRPEAASALFGARAGESVAREAPLYDLLAAQPVRDLEERVADARTDAEAGAAVHALLRAALARQAPVPPAVRAAVSAILLSRGTFRIERVADGCGVGRRQLERLFAAHVGVPPKRLATLARFAWAAAQLRRDVSWTQLALRAGYSDQAHFIRGFAELAGAPPARFLTSRPDAEPSHFFNTDA